MATKKYQDALKQMVQDLIDEIIDDAFGIAAWKGKRGKVCLTTPINQYGTGDFPSDSGSPLSTFSSTPNTSSNSAATSPITPSFEDLADTQITDNEAEPVQLNSETKDDELVKYLIGETSDSEEEKHHTNLMACANIEDKENANPDLPMIKITEADTTNLHETNIVRAPMVPINANIVVETIAESEKNNIQAMGKGKMKVTGRGDHSLTKQQEIHKQYIKKGKDLSKLKTYLAKQTNKEIDFSMPKTK